jgi:hypothetical protein
MTYVSGGLIQATDYNGFANNTAGANVNSIWGAGTGDAGYGQSTTLATVAAGTDNVTAVQWSNLNNRISSIASHQNTAITSRTNPVVGDTIGILSALNTDLTNITNNRGNAAASGTTSSTWTGTTSKNTGTGSGTSAWTITFTHVVSFADANSARYFWNAGGLVRLDMSKTNNVTDADPEWNSSPGIGLINRIGVLYFSGRVNNANQTIGGNIYTGLTRVGGTGTPLPFNNTIGWYQLASGAAPTVMFQLNDTVAGYTGNYVRVTAAVNAGRTALTLVTTWVSVGSSGAGTSANISGGSDTVSPFSSFGTAPAVLCRFIPPSTTFLTNTWGTPSVSASFV